MEAKPPKQGYWVKVSQRFKHLKLLPKVFELIRPNIITFAIAYGFQFLLTAINLRKAKYVGGIIDIASGERQLDDALWLLAEAGVCYILIKLLNKWYRIANARIVAVLDKKVKGNLYMNVLEKDMEFFDKKNPYEAIQEVNKGMEGIQNLCTRRFHGTINQLIRLFGTFTMLYGISHQLTLIVLLILPLRLYLDGHKLKFYSKSSKKYMELAHQVNEIPNYSKDYIFLIKALSTEDKELEQFVEKANKCVVEPKPTEKSFLDIKLVKGLMGKLLQGIVVSYGGFLIMRNKLTYGDLVTYNLHFVGFITSISSALTNFKIMLKSLQQSEKLFEVIEYEPKIKLHDTDAIKNTPITGDIAIRDVSFSYPTQPKLEVLKEISLEVKPGQSLEIVGSSKSGKTTLASLLLRLYDPIKGEILIDGKSIKNYEVAWLHQNIGFVSQEPFLFDGTIEENVLYGAVPSQKENIEQVLEMSGAGFVLDKKEFLNGFQTRLGLNAVQLSMKQKRKICIARALVKEPKILIMDEPLTNLGNQEKHEIQEIIQRLITMKDKTVIIFSKELMSIEKFDKIYMLEERRMVKQ